MTNARWIAIAGALVGVAGLALQYVILVGDMVADGATALEATWRYFAYFTILTNTFVTLVFISAALGATAGPLNGPRVELMAVTSILFVCIVYNLLLASRWDPQGWQKVADVIVHQVVPVLFALYWLARPRGLLKWSDAMFAALWPAAYAVYGLARGAFDHFYPYFFMDPSVLPVTRLALNMLGLVAAFLVGALIVVGVDRALSARAARAA